MCGGGVAAWVPAVVASPDRSGLQCLYRKVVVVELCNAVWSVDLYKATFSGGTVTFPDETFSGAEVTFKATFTGATVSFFESKIAGGHLTFDDATFTGGTVTRDGVEFRGWLDIASIDEPQDSDR